MWVAAKALIHAASDGGQPIQTVQPPYNLAQREIESDLLPLCADRNIGVISYSPLAAGFLSGKYRRGRDIPKGSRLAVSTNLLGGLIAACMRATGQTQSLEGPLQEHERRIAAARAILGEWLGGSGGGWQDSGGV